MLPETLSVGFVLVVRLLSACGGDDGGERVVVLTINLPSSAGSYQTDQAYVSLQGHSFKPERVVGPMPGA